MSLLIGLSSSNHFFLPPFISLTSLNPWYLNAQKANAANQLLKSPYNTSTVLLLTPAPCSKSSQACLLKILRVIGSFMSFFQSNNTDPVCALDCNWLLDHSPPLLCEPGGHSCDPLSTGYQPELQGVRNSLAFIS